MRRFRNTGAGQETRRGWIRKCLSRAGGLALVCALGGGAAVAVAPVLDRGEPIQLLEKPPRSAIQPGIEEAARSPARSRAADAATGSLEGTVLLGPKLSTRKLRFHLYPDAPRPAVQEKPAFESETQNVVVYLESEELAKVDVPRRSTARVMQQENLSFVPHVLPVLKGATVEFPNSDPIFHNVFSLSRAASFDLGRYPQGASKSVRFDEPGMIKVFCHVHSDMSAVIVVLDNPFFATPDRQGRYRIDGIPPGEYRAIGWHERARAVRRTIRIEAGAVTVRDFSIPLAEASDGG